MGDTPKKLMILDGNSIVNRAFYGIRMLNAPDGTPTNGVYGFLAIFQRLMEQEKPDGNFSTLACKSIVSTSLANRICESYGVKMFEVLTGFKFIGEKIQQFQDSGDYVFQFGFEESYGFLSSTFVRDKDGVNASLLVTEVAAACEEEGITLYDRMQQIFKEYGYYVEKVVSTTLPGKDGLSRMKEIMAGLRENPPKEIGALKVTAVRDYLKGTRVCGDSCVPTGLPTSDVLYFELEGGNWVCVRPSGTEPKIKLYVNTNAKDQAEANRLNAELGEASQALMK